MYAGTLVEGGEEVKVRVQFDSERDGEWTYFAVSIGTYRRIILLQLALSVSQSVS